MEFVSANKIRSDFSALMSEMYQKEVPLYGDLLDLVKDINAQTLSQNIELKNQLKATGEQDRLSLERHGAIRLGTALELQNICRIFAVMGMQPVGYYDLVPAGVPVFATAFRAVQSEDLNECPFRVFTSLLRLELIEDEHLRNISHKILQKRQIFTEKALALTTKFEQQKGLNAFDAAEFIQEVLETFRWHKEAAVSQELYDSLHQQHRLIADVVAFKGPHINHLTPRTLDIDWAQREMLKLGMSPKAVIEGPPTRKCPILLRQTSFKALEEKVFFPSEQQVNMGTHTARFGEIEQRGIALTLKGRKLYDELLDKSREQLGEAPNEYNSEKYIQILHDNFKKFPDDYNSLRLEKLAFFQYFLNENLDVDMRNFSEESEFEFLISQGVISFEPIVYEDFLPVSAAGIFQSNLGDQQQTIYDLTSSQHVFEQHLGRKVINEIEIYESIQQQSIENIKEKMKKRA